MVVEGFWASSEADRLETASFDFYETTFPRESQPVGIDQLRRRMAAKLGEQVSGGEASAFVGLTAHLANALTTDNLMVQLGFNDRRQELTAEVMMQNYDQLEVLKTELASAGVGVEVASAENEGELVRSRIRVKYQ